MNDQRDPAPNASAPDLSAVPAPSDAPAAPEAPPKKPIPKGLKPWVKGQSGNPAGVPGFMKQIHLQFRDKIPMLLNRLYLLAMKNDNAVGVMAAREFMDRTVGKAPQTIIERAAEPLPSDFWGDLDKDKLDEIIKADGALPPDVEAALVATGSAGERAAG